MCMAVFFQSAKLAVKTESEVKAWVHVCTAIAGGLVGVSPGHEFAVAAQSADQVEKVPPLKFLGSNF